MALNTKILNRIKKNTLNKKVFIITGKNSFIKSGAKDKLKFILKESNYSCYFKRNDLPEYSEFCNLIRKINKFKPDVILGIGGGTSIDYAKLAGVINTLKDLKKNIQFNSFKDFKKKITTLIIPTTAGTGAEETSFATIFIKKKKYSIAHKLIKPSKFFIIPSLLLSTSNYVRACSGLDTICQSTESLLSKNSNNISVKHAVKSLKIALKYFIPFMTKETLFNASKMSQAANLSGKAINISKTTGPHAVSYYFSTHHSLGHGHAVALTINSFLYFNYLNIENSSAKFSLKKRYDILFKLTKSKSIKQLNIYFKNIINKSKLEINYKKLKININNKIKKVVRETNVERLSNNPILINKNNLFQVVINNEYKNFKNINK